MTGRLFDLPENGDSITYLNDLCAQVANHGVRVVRDFNSQDGARFIGLFESRTITLYPNAAPVFALWFTVAHLYGHMVQMQSENARVRRANALVRRTGEELSPADVQLIYDHEREAAEIGRALVESAGRDGTRLPPAMDSAYSRFFHADFRYLIGFIETGEGGAAAFARYWRREPVPRELIRPDARPLPIINETSTGERVIVV